MATDMELSQRTEASSRGKKIASWLAGLAVIVGLGLFARTLAGPSQASADGPRARTAARPAPTQAPRTAARPTAPVASTPQPGQAPNSVMAIVNGEQITRDHLARECIRRYGEEVLEGLVNKYLIAQACRDRGVTITEKDVMDEIDRMAGKFGLSTDRWLTLLKDERNISAEEYKNEIIWPMLALRRLAANEIEVTQEELKKAFESEHGPKVKTRIIVANTREKAEQLHAKAKADPEAFGDIAKNESDDKTSAAARGLVPPIRKHVGDPNLEQAAFALKPGEISDVIQVADQFVILKCESVIPGSYVSGENLAAEEERLRETIRDQKLRTAAAEMFKQMQEKAQLVNVYNDSQLRNQMPGVAATINGHQITMAELADECVQRHGEEVLDGEINRLILTQALRAAGKSITQEDLDAEIARAAEAYGYLMPDGSADVERWLQHVTTEGGEGATVDLYVADAVWPSVALKKLVGEKIEVTEDDMQKGFESNYGERVQVLAIVMSNQRRAQQVWEMARNNPTDDFFGNLASEYSIEPVSRANFGKVPPIRMHGGNDAVEKEAFRLKPGELSSIVAVGDKYIIMRCLGRTVPEVTDIETVRDELYKDLHEKKLRAAMAREFDRLKESAKTQTFLAGVVTRGRLQPSSPEGSEMRTVKAPAPAPAAPPAQAARPAGAKRR